MEYTTIRELVETALKKGRSIGKAVLEDQAVQMEQSEEALMAQMEKIIPTCLMIFITCLLICQFWSKPFPIIHQTGELHKMIFLCIR